MATTASTAHPGRRRWWPAGWPTRWGRTRWLRRLHDGSIDVVLGVSSFASIRSWLLGLLDHAVVLEPSGFRDEMVAWLDALGPPPLAAPATGRARRRMPPTTTARPPSPGAAGRTRGGDSRRLRRLLAVVGWLAQVGEAPMTDIAQRFGMSEKELVAELELAACCGIPPYTPDTLMEIEVSEHSVRASCRRSTPGPAASPRPRVSPWPPRRGCCSPSPAPTTTRCAVPWPSWTPRGSGRRSGSCRRAGPPGRRAGSGRCRAGPRDRYLSASRDELTTRTVEPVQVITVDGHWYLDAYCHRAGDMRRFRVDRIGAVRPLDERPADDGPHPSAGGHVRAGPGASRSICGSARARNGCPSRSGARGGARRRAAR